MTNMTRTKDRLKSSFTILGLILLEKGYSTKKGAISFRSTQLKVSTLYPVTGRSEL